MKILDGEEVAERVEGIVYPYTQASDTGLDLTAGKIYRIEGRGEIDFSGDEREDSELSEIEPELRNSEDDYGWWELEEGTYLLEFNERVKGERIVFLQPLPRLTRNSATHPCGFVEGLGLIPLQVSKEGISIKENSRTSKLMIFE